MSNDAMIFADDNDDPMDLTVGSSSENEDTDSEEASIPADFVEPTADEMSELKETKELFKSNLFKLQIEELLAEVSVKYDKLSKLETLLHCIKTSLDELPGKEVEQAVGHAVLNVPFPSFRAFPLKLALSKPKRVDMVGSYLLRW